MNTKHRIVVLLLLALTACAGPETKEMKDEGGINAKFMAEDLDPEAWVKRWEVESREIYAARKEIVAALGLKPGDEIADIGSGTGLFVEPFSKAVGEWGRVVAVDIAPGFVDYIKQRVDREGLHNVEARLCRSDSVDLADGAVEFAFVCDTYHHFEEPAKTMTSIFRAMRPDGELFVIDFERIEGQSRPWVLGHVRAGKEVFRAEIEAAGFVFVEERPIEGFRENYFLRFRRP